MSDPRLTVFQNLARHHREHEKYYAEAPLHEALELQRFSRTLKALAERWSVATPVESAVPSPFAGAPDLNDERAIETSGVLFMEQGGPPAEIEHIKREVESMAAAADETGRWLAEAMDASWRFAEGLLDFADLADLVGERHSIIAHDMLNASMLTLMARQLRRANTILERVDFSVGPLRADLSGPRHSPAYIFSAAELLDQAADLAAESAMLVHGNERKWRVFLARVDEIADSGDP